VVTSVTASQRHSARHVDDRCGAGVVIVESC
jgi:hypothetical protein